MTAPAPSPEETDVNSPKIRRILWACTLAVLVFVSFTAGYMVALSLGSALPARRDGNQSTLTIKDPVTAT